MHELCRHCCEPPSAHAAKTKCLFTPTLFEANKCKRCGSAFVYSGRGADFARHYWVDRCLSCEYKHNQEIGRWR